MLDFCTQPGRRTTSQFGLYGLQGRSPCTEARRASTPLLPNVPLGTLTTPKKFQPRAGFGYSAAQRLVLTPNNETVSVSGTPYVSPISIGFARFLRERARHVCFNVPKAFWNRENGARQRVIFDFGAPASLRGPKNREKNVVGQNVWDNVRSCPAKKFFESDANCARSASFSKRYILRSKIRKRELYLLPDGHSHGEAGRISWIAAKFRSE